MILPVPGSQYSQNDEAQARSLIVREFNKARQKGDLEISPSERLIMTDTVTGTKYVVSIASGSWTLTAL